MQLDVFINILVNYVCSRVGGYNNYKFKFVMLNEYKLIYVVDLMFLEVCK